MIAYRLGRQTKWRFIDVTFPSAAMNMAIDEAIFEAFRKGLVPPTLRAYEWNSPALSVGRFQKLDGIDVEHCNELGVQIVRRITGGRAVLHDADVSYSIVLAREEGFPKSSADSYRFLCQGLIRAYEVLGVEVELAPSKGSDSPICFLGFSLADLSYRGRKIAGGAQIWRKGFLLQQGSLLMDFDEKALFTVLRHPRHQDVSCKIISLQQIMGGPVEISRFKDALLRGFQETLGISLNVSKLTNWEVDCARRLFRDRYTDASWTLLGS
ncbi:MAG: lipoate--protein ligase family protein [Actinomycetota bacterium]|nr:lipoate--protein ligase family protein [Actinomycetota bacterium]